VIGLVADLVVAVLRVAARLNRVSPASSPQVVVDAQPAGAAASAATGPGGHPIRPTSELLKDAAIWVAVDFPDAETFVCELEDRAARLALAGD
jgi:hypothetical protein